MHDNIILLFGGANGERLVSVASAQNLITIVPQATCWFWTPEDQIQEVTKDELLAHQNPFIEPFAPQKILQHWSTVEKALDSERAKSGLFLLALHGVGVEDGILQHWLEVRGLPFTGSSAQSSQDAFNKSKAKELVSAAGVQVAPSYLVNGADSARANRKLKELLREYGKIAVKPVADGSSVGLFIIADDDALNSCLQALRENPTRECIAEAFIEGTELTTGVIETPKGLVALTCTEIRSDKGHIFDYTGKYLGKGTKEITPAEVPSAWTDAAKQIALTAHQALGCRGYSRTDVIFSSHGPVYLETNTLPGLTKASLVPQQLACDGISMTDFIENQLQIALAKNTK